MALNEKCFNLHNKYMSYIYEKNIVDIKHEYYTHLTEILTPLLYEGILSILARAKEHCAKYEQLSKENDSIKNPGLIKIFQICLKDVPTLSAAAIETETLRIKEQSHCSEFFDDLIKAVVKSYIVLLTYNASGGTCELIREKIHDKVDINKFIHTCYIECAQSFYNNPDLVVRIPDKSYKSYQKNLITKYIKAAIHKAINKILPYKSMLDEYLRNDEIIMRQIPKRTLEKYVHPSRDEIPIVGPHEEIQNGFSVVREDPILIEDPNDSLVNEKKSVDNTQLVLKDEQHTKTDIADVIKENNLPKNDGLKEISVNSSSLEPGIMIKGVQPDGSIIKPGAKIMSADKPPMNGGINNEMDQINNIDYAAIDDFFKSEGNL